MVCASGPSTSVVILVFLLVGSGLGVLVATPGGGHAGKPSTVSAGVATATAPRPSESLWPATPGATPRLVDDSVVNPNAFGGVRPLGRWASRLGAPDSPENFTVTFDEVGLSNGTLWAIFIFVVADPAYNGTILSVSSSLTISGVGNGTYGFDVRDAYGFVATPSNGTLIVDGAPVTETIVFSKPSYSVVLNTDLASFGATSVLDFAASGIVPPFNYTGWFTGAVDTANGSQECFMYFAGNVSDNKSSLSCPSTPTNIAWTAGVVGCTPQTNCEQPGMTQSNGRYISESYSPALWGMVSSWVTINVTSYNGSSEPDVSIEINASILNGANSTGSACPCGLNITGFVDSNDSEYSRLFMNTTDVRLALAPGYYTYQFAAVDGWPGPLVPGFSYSVGEFAVGTNETLYDVDLSETGLPDGTNWSATLGGRTESTDGSVLTFDNLTDGDTYCGSLSSIDPAVIPASGCLTVNGSEAVDGVITVPEDFYNVTFEQSNQSLLPEGQQWNVTLNDVLGTAQTAGDDINFLALTDYTYTYHVVPALGYTDAPAAGTLTVEGDDVLVDNVTFLPAGYAVLFSETGLPAGMTWGVTVNGTSQSATAGANLSFLLPNGTYGYSVHGVPGYHQKSLPYSGTLIVHNPIQAISKTLAFAPFRSLVTFNETGLPRNTTWSVSLGEVLVKNNTSSVTFTAVNGTYNFTVAAVGSMVPLMATGNVTVDAAPQNESVKFVSTFSVSFYETGLAPGTNWSVSASGTLSGAGIAWLAPSVSYTAERWSMGASSVVLNLPNGTYDYITTASGAQSVSGSVTVSGASPPPVSVPFGTPSHNSGGGSTFLGFPAFEGYAIVAGIALIVILVIATLARRKG